MMDSDADDSSIAEQDVRELLSTPGLYKEIILPKHHVNCKEALLNTLAHIHNGLPWLERLDVVTNPAPAPKELLAATDSSSNINPDDDFQRENYFHRLAQAAVLVAIPRLHELNVPTKRPTDYFAEMLKSDDHMTKIKKNLLETQQRLSLHERARQARERRKFGKQTQLAVLQARKDEKRKLTEAVKASRKKTGRKDQLELLDSVLDEFRDRQGNELPKADSSKEKQFFRAKDVAKRRSFNRKRDYKNKRYGHGGQKKRAKYNTAESTASVRLDGSIKSSGMTNVPFGNTKKTQKVSPGRKLKAAVHKKAKSKRMIF